MFKEIVSTIGSFLFEQDLFRWGVIAVSVVIFFMGFLKKLLINKIKNKLIRKVTLAWGSIITALPVTAVITYFENFESAYFWTLYITNCISTIVVYWFYENTALRDGLSRLGKKVVSIFTCNKTKSGKKAIKDIHEEVETLLATSIKSTSYKDDDLKKL